MDAQQQIRATAAQVAATLMASAGPPPGDFVMAADVVAAFIEHGLDAALVRAGVTGDPAPAPVIVPTAESPEPMALLVTGHREFTEPVFQDAVPVQQEPGPQQEPERNADVIPLAARGEVNLKQQKARSAIDKIKHERAMKIYRQFEMAKAEGHRQKLRDEAEEAELTDFPIVVNGEAKTLGTYLGL